MPRKRHKPEEIVAKLRQVDVLVSQDPEVKRNSLCLMGHLCCYWQTGGPYGSSDQWLILEQPV